MGQASALEEAATEAEATEAAAGAGVAEQILTLEAEGALKE